MAEPVYIFSSGAFGEAVARYLEALRGDVVPMPASIDSAPDEWPLARISVVAAWRPEHALCETLDRLSHARGRPFIPLVADSRTLRLGPIVVPGGGSCWNCWRQRSRQHASWLDRRAAVWKHYDGSPEAGPRGYFAPFAMLGAVRISQTIEELDAQAPIGGRLWEIDMITRQIAASTVVGVHNCPRCGLHRPAEDRGFAELRQALQGMWSS